MIVTDENFSEVIASHKLVMIDFWAEWCRPCKMFSPVIEEVSADTGVWLGKMNVDENPQKTLEYEISSLPTTILFKNGEPVKRVIGAKPKHVMIKEIQEWI